MWLTCCPHLPADKPRQSFVHPVGNAVLGDCPGFVDSLTSQAGARGRMLTVPTAYGTEFRRDVIAVARKGEAPLAQLCEEFWAFGRDIEALDRRRRG